MIKIRYNIASHKKVDSPRLFFLASFLFFLSLIFISLGIWKLSSESKQERFEVEELNILKEKLADVSDMSEEYKKKINEIKKKWSKKIHFSNSLINWKSFSLIEKLNILENLIPAGVFVNNLGAVNGPESVLQVGFISSSFKNLMILYKQFSKYNIVIKKETVLPSGMYSADLMMKIADEKD